MHFLEMKALDQFVYFGLYRRYVNDCLILVKNNEEADRLINVFNSQNSSVQFEIEKCNEQQVISLLDFKLKINEGKAIISFYKKDAKSDLFVNYHSNTSLRNKRSFANNELSRVKGRCNTPDDQQKHTKAFQKILILNEYPEKEIKGIMENNNKDSRHISRGTKKEKWSKRNNKVEGKPFYLKCKYFNDRVNDRMRNVLMREGFNVRLAPKNNTMKNILMKKSGRREEQVCKRNSCKIKEMNICFKKFVFTKSYVRNVEKVMWGRR